MGGVNDGSGMIGSAKVDHGTGDKVGAGNGQGKGAVAGGLG